MVQSSFITSGIILSSIPPAMVSAAQSFIPYGFQSGNFHDPSKQSPSSPSELLNDDSYAASAYHDPQHNLLFITGSTYSTFFDSATNLSTEIKAAMGMSSEGDAGHDMAKPHLDYSDCFLGVLKLPQGDAGPMVVVGNGDGDAAPWLDHVDDQGGANAESAPKKITEPELIYARRFGTPDNSETCSSVLMLPRVSDALLQTTAQLKLVMLGHVNPTPLSSADMNSMGPTASSEPVVEAAYNMVAGGGERHLRQKLDRLLDGVSSHGEKHELERKEVDDSSSQSRMLQNNVNRGGFFHSLSTTHPIKQRGRAYGYVADFDLTLTLDETFTTNIPTDTSFSNAYGALLGGYVLDSSPLIYPTAMTQNGRDPNQLYVVSMHSDTEDVILNPDFGENPDESVWIDKSDGSIHERADMTMGGAGGSGSKLVAGVPKYGTDFYVKVQQLTVTPYEKLMNVEPTADEHVKRTMESGWGFGFKLNDAQDVRPSSIVFVRGRTPDDDILLLGGTTRKEEDGELDGFITKLIPPSPSPVADMTTGDSVENAVEDESVHPTKRIDSTTGRDETVTAICLPPPDPIDGVITHAYVVGSTTSQGSDASLAYLLKLRLDDLSTVWKEHVPSIHPEGIGGDVLGEGCAVSPDGSMVYLGGTIDGGSALNTHIMSNSDGMIIKPVGGTSDVFAVAFDTDFGNVKWAKQMGTVYEDKLARGSGGISCDNEGNAIIVGSTRGDLQRPRSKAIATANTGRSSMASDVFVMILSRTDGEHANAPFGTIPITASGGSFAPNADDPVLEPMPEGKGGLSSGAITGISLTVIVFGIGFLIYVLRIRHRQSRRGNLAHKIHRFRNKDPMEEDMNDVLRGWDGDHMSYNNQPLGGRRSSTTPRKGSGLVRMVQGGRGKNNGAGSGRSWMTSRGGGGDDDDNSVGSSSSRKSQENSDFLASLRQEANSTMTKMVKDPETAKITEDPRIDGGASIKSLLTHYREVKKDTLMEAGDSVTSSPGMRGRKNPPPPPPPRRKREYQTSAELTSGATSIGSNTPDADGLSEFTIV